MTNRMRGLPTAILLALVLGLWPGAAGTIPVFARKYGFQCTMCHSHFPRLNDFGWRFRANGYQLPGRETEERTVIQVGAPFAARVTAGYVRDQFRNTPDAEEVNEFRVESVDLLSGGLIRRNIGYLLVYPPQIEASRGVAGQTGTVEMANVVFANLGSKWLNVRAGRFEPSFSAFSDKRRLTFSPFEAFDFTFPGGPALSDTRSGVELYGYQWNDTRYYAGLVNGGQTENADDSPSDLYVRASHVCGRGEGQTSGYELGVTGYFGRARPEAVPDLGRKHFTRLAADASLNLPVGWNLGLQWVHGSDDADLWGAASDVSWNAGFAQVLYGPSDDWVTFARYGFVNAPTAAGGDITRWTVGGRYYPAYNLALHLEFSERRQDEVTVGTGRPREHYFTTSLDWAF